MPNICVLCGREFTPKRQNKQFCSNQCRQAAYRYGKLSKDNLTASRSKAARDAAITKGNSSKSYQCHYCGKKFTASLLQAKRLYCSNTCKQANYRRGHIQVDYPIRLLFEDTNIRKDIQADFQCRAKLGLELISDGKLLWLRLTTQRY